MAITRPRPRVRQLQLQHLPDWFGQLHRQPARLQAVADVPFIRTVRLNPYCYRTYCFWDEDKNDFQPGLELTTYPLFTWIPGNSQSVYRGKKFSGKWMALGSWIIQLPSTDDPLFARLPDRDKERISNIHPTIYNPYSYGCTGGFGTYMEQYRAKQDWVSLAMVSLQNLTDFDDQIIPDLWDAWDENGYPGLVSAADSVGLTPISKTTLAAYQRNAAKPGKILPPGMHSQVLSEDPFPEDFPTRFRLV